MPLATEYVNATSHFFFSVSIISWVLSIAMVLLTRPRAWWDAFFFLCCKEEPAKRCCRRDQSVSSDAKGKPCEFLTIQPPAHMLPSSSSRYFHFLLVCFCLFTAHLQHMKVPGAKGWIRAVAAGLHHRHSNVGSKAHLWPTPLLTATLDP